MDSIMDKPFYKKSNFKLYQANCLELLTQIPENSIDMVFADPPYFLSKKLRLVKKF
jgi:site-specific DNA-methyltransferase (adenine-specific)